MRALLVAALLLPAAASAGPRLGLRIAWAPAVGSAADSVSMSEAVGWHVPLQADALWSWGAWEAGLYGSWGPGQAGEDACADGASCSAQVFRAGAQALGRLPWSIAGAQGWLGAALGWEWASHRRERAGAATTTRWSGPELALQGGVEWRVRGDFALGPFALLGLGQYRSVSLGTAEDSGSGTIPDRAVHAWIHLGVRGTWDL
jgi:hypothetical protein